MTKSKQAAKSKQKSKSKTKPKRVACPFCKELIIEGAKKCRFCGEMLVVKKTKKTGFWRKKLSPRILYWLWLSSCLVFLMVMSLSTVDKNIALSDSLSIVLIGLVLLSIFIGGAAFLGLIITVLTTLNKKQSRWYAAATVGGLFVFFSLLTNHSTVLAGLGLSSNKSSHQSNQTSGSTLQDSSKPVEVIDESTVKYEETSQKKAIKPTQSLDQSDRPVHCNVHPNCGGGTTPLTKAECDNSICCQIGDEWIFYKDKEQCEKDQEKNSSKQVLVTCETDLGTYELTESDCEYYQQFAKSQQKSYDYQPAEEPVKNEVTVQPSPSFDYEEYAYEMLQALETCKGDARRRYQNSITRAGNAARAAGGQLMGTDRLDKQLERDIEYCKSLYSLED